MENHLIDYVHCYIAMGTDIIKFHFHFNLFERQIIHMINI